MQNRCFGIIAVAQCLRQVCEDAILCRFGGDELVILDRSLSANELGDRLEEIRNALMQSCPRSGNDYLQSFSYGLVHFDEEKDGANESDLLRLADERMYEYKRSHRAERNDLLGQS